MTIDELRARKQELLARKKYEMELQEQGKGDNFALFMVNEELLDVNAQLRAIRPAGNRQQIGPRGRRITADFSARFNAGDHQQFIDWTREDSDQEADEARAKVLDMLHTVELLPATVLGTIGILLGKRVGLKMLKKISKENMMKLVYSMIAVSGILTIAANT